MTGRIDGTTVYLTEEQLPAFTLSVQDLTDPSKLRGTRSSTMRVINTKELRRVLGGEGMNVPGRAGTPELVIGDGTVDLFRANIVTIRQDRNEAEAIAVGGNAAWFDWARATKVRDLDLGESPAITAAYQRATWTDPTDMVVFPLVDFGAFEGQPDTYDVQTTQLRPGLRMARVLEEAFATQDYTIQPRGTLASKWPHFVSFEPAANVQSIASPTDPERGVAQLFGAGGICDTTPVLSIPGFLRLSGINFPPLVPAAGRYLVPFDCRLLVTVTNFLLGPIPLALDGERVRFVLYEKTQNLPLAVIVSDPLTAGATINVDLEFPEVNVEAGQQVNVGIWNETAGTVSISYPGGGGNVFQFLPQTRPYTAGVPLERATCSKDLKVLDLVTALAGSQFLVLDTNTQTRTVNVWYEREFYRTPAPGVRVRDWRNRIDHSTPPAKLKEETPRAIDYGWKADDGDVSRTRQDTLLPSPGYGNARVELGGYGQAQEVRIPYAASAMGYVLGGLRIPIMRDDNAVTGVDVYKRQPRLLYCDGQEDGNWTHDGVAVGQYSRAYFAWTSEGHPVAFGNVVVYADEATAQTVDTYGTTRHRRMRDARTLEAFALIHDHELQDFDHGMPTLVDDGHGPAWYYVAEINAHRFGRFIPTKCKLVEIPGTWVDAAAVTPDVVPVTYPAILQLPPFIPPCTNAPRFPSLPYVVSYAFNASLQASVEADPSTFPVGMRIFVKGQGSPTFLAWEQWTGSVVQRVAAGTGTDGTEWLRIPLAAGAIVENLDAASATGWDRYYRVNAYPSYLSNNGAAWWLQTPYIDNTGQWGFFDVPSVSDGLNTTDFTSFEDACRMVVIQYNATADQSTGWVDCAEGEQAFGGGTIQNTTVPPGAIYARAKFMRGTNLQGYSDRVAL